MVSQLYDVLLHILTRHTNKEKPYSDYVSGDTFPAQNSELLNTEVTIKYRDYYQYDNANMRRETSGRPSDDNQTSYSIGPDDYDDNLIRTDKFTVLRADAAEPYRLIAVNRDYTRILVNSSKPTDTGYEFDTLVSEYPVQYNEYIGIGVYAQYPGDERQIKACTLRVDHGEPCHSIMMEYLGSTGKVRFTFGDEHFSVLYDYFDYDGSRDYNGRSAEDNTELYPVDVEGGIADNSSISSFRDVNGGYANTFDRMYTKEVIKNDLEVAEFRKNVMEGISIYGTV